MNQHHMRINLLPWRDEQRTEQKRQFISLLIVSAIIAALLVLLVHLIIVGRISRQKGRNAYLKSEIKLLDKKIVEIRGLQKQKENLIARMNIIQKLQQSRFIVVRFFHEIVDIIPASITLEKVTRINNEVRLVGKANSNANISALMRNVQKNQDFSNPRLTEIKTKKYHGIKFHDFTLNLMQKISSEGSQSYLKKSSRRRRKRGR